MWSEQVGFHVEEEQAAPVALGVVHLDGPRDAYKLNLRHSKNHDLGRTYFIQKGFYYTMTGSALKVAQHSVSAQGGRVCLRLGFAGSLRASAANLVQGPVRETH